MTKKILYWLDRNFITFAAANKLQNKIHSDNYAIIDDVEDQKNFFSNQSLINFKKIWHFTDFVQVKNVKPDFKLLQKLEQKYSLNFWHTAYTERLFYPKVNLYNKYNKYQILSLFQQECEFFEKVLDEIKPDYLIISVITQQHMFLIYQICKSKGIKVLTMEPMHFGGKWLITSTIDRHIDINDYEKFSPSSEKTIEEKSVMPGLTDSNSFSACVYKSVSFFTFGRGPTKLISPSKTFHSCVNSSSLYLRIKCPTEVILVSLELVESTPVLSAFIIIDLSFTIVKFF